jgi:hypothetical protein
VICLNDSNESLVILVVGLPIIIIIGRFAKQTFLSKRGRFYICASAAKARVRCVGVFGRGAWGVGPAAAGL